MAGCIAMPTRKTVAKSLKCFKAMREAAVSSLDRWGFMLVICYVPLCRLFPWEVCISPFSSPQHQGWTCHTALQLDWLVCCGHSKTLPAFSLGLSLLAAKLPLCSTHSPWSLHPRSTAPLSSTAEHFPPSSPVRSSCSAYPACKAQIPLFSANRTKFVCTDPKYIR